MLKSRNLVQPEDFSIKEIDEILDLAQQIMANPDKYSEVCKGKLLATLFYEPSTRTRLSFESAMKRLGGNVVGFSEPGSSSASKGESLADTIRIVSGYVDIIAMRHPIAGSADEAVKYTEVPFINAGDGGNQHPTQTLTDLLTIKTLKDGSFIDLENNKEAKFLEKLVTGMDISYKDLEKEELKLPVYRISYFNQLLKEIKGTEITKNDEYKNIINQLDKEQLEEEIKVPENLNSVLRYYQKTGFKWLKILDRYHFGGILADDMGLRKNYSNVISNS